ncbi:Holliday junction DNA helicase subunit RuvA [Litoreibacter ascidiaceicola]|uniref:Holliday junction branch migration complex subunit RuvA n=1 Tax=Litoreibacter ascidiaceicola TaxID=1486859 RepID=A0A1M4Y6T5_9RHOB|nr:Holliday junction branch migration protein RuvA [Litoreibacter ascidiaceicola]SHF01172.1 Holliday junction DNA helicase subunit RuvA [Litoreibacter ascidiaceicola]
MIGKLSGRLDYRATDHVLIDVGGVGYMVYCSERTMAVLPGPGEAVSLFTELLVREDLLQLFGFTTLIEKEWHRMLITVQGVGAKASMAILSTLGPDGVSRAVTLGDWNAIKAAKGIGPKTAQKVVLELKDKAPKVMAMGGSLAAAQGTVVAAPENDDVNDDVIERVTTSSASSQAEALSALINLGYAHGDAASAVAQAAGDGAAETPALIRTALKLLAPKE